MFNQTWKKYLPVINLLFKRSLKSDQVLSMNSTDFQKAAGGRKVKYSFSFVLHKGRIENFEKAPPVARDLVQTLLENDLAKKFLSQQTISFTLTNAFQLTIKNLTPPVVTEEEKLVTEEVLNEPGEKVDEPGLKPE